MNRAPRHPIGDDMQALHELYGPWGAASRAHVVERYAEQLCSLCTSLGELLPRSRRRIRTQHTHSLSRSSAAHLLLAATPPAARMPPSDPHTWPPAAGVRCRASAHPVAKQFAKRVAAMLSERTTAAGERAAQRRRPRATVLIIDRAEDVLTPLLHDFSCAPRAC